MHLIVKLPCVRRLRNCHYNVDEEEVTRNLNCPGTARSSGERSSTPARCEGVQGAGQSGGGWLGGRGAGLEIMTERGGKSKRRTASIIGGRNLTDPVLSLSRT